MAVQIRNLNDLRSEDQKLYETLTDIVSQVNNVAQQTNSNPADVVEAPPAISSLNVTGQNGFFHGAIADHNHIYRGINYFVEHADNPNFTDPQIVHLGPSRNFTLQLGNTTRYWRAYSSYGSSPPSSPAYHGNAAYPQPVSAGGPLGPPNFLPSQGSGTGAVGQGLSGQGPIPFRSPDGKPPIRGTVPNTSGSGGSAVTPSALGVPNPSLTAAAGKGGGAGGVGTVTSAGLSSPAEFTVSGSPVTTAGTLTFTKATQSANTVWAGPTSGAAAQPTFRSLVSADLPLVPIVSIVGCRAVSTGIAAIIQIPFNLTITGWAIISDVSGTVSVDVDFHSGSAPPSAPSIPNTSTDKISASAPVAISAAQSAAGGSSAISTWTTSLTQWGSVQFNVTSFSGCSWAQVSIYGTRS